MPGYRTRIVIPPDRTVVVQLPADLPDGPATLIIQYEPAPPRAATVPAAEPETDPWAGSDDDGPPALEALDIDWFD